MDEMKTNSGRVFFGVFLIVIGVITLYAKLDIDLLGIWRDAVLSIPMALIIIGIFALFSRHLLSGFAFIGVGVFFILPLVPYDVVPMGFCGKWYPLLLVYVGALFLLFRKTPASHVTPGDDHAQPTQPAHDESVHVDEAGRIDCRVGLHGEKLIFSEPVFKGGEIMVNGGGLELDLRNTRLDSGDVSLYVNVHLGGVTLYIPQDWAVEIHTNGILGGFVDKRTNVTTSFSNSRLHVYVNTFIGGGEIRD